MIFLFLRGCLQHCVEWFWLEVASGRNCGWACRMEGRLYLSMSRLYLYFDTVLFRKQGNNSYLIKCATQQTCPLQMVLCNGLGEPLYHLFLWKMKKLLLGIKCIGYRKVSNESFILRLIQRNWRPTIPSTDPSWSTSFSQRMPGTRWA